MDLYRFRSMDNLLGKYQELEKRAIYFASPDELNDPMEGIRDIVWRGDKIVWEKFFKHYVYCFHQGLLQSILAGDSEELTVQDIPILSIWDQLPPPAQRLFDDIWDRFLNLPNILEIIEALSNSSRKIRYRELKCYLRYLMSVMSNKIVDSYVVHKMLPESEKPKPIEDSLVQVFLKEILTLIRQNEEAKTEQEVQSELLKIEAVADNNIIFMHQENPDIPEVVRKNYQLGQYDFPNTYFGEIGRLLWPNWYAACFMKSYHNSSVWGHYGDQHRGVCLIFEPVKAGNHGGLNLSQSTSKSVKVMPFFKIDYVDKPGEVDFFSSIGNLPSDELKRLWFTDDEGHVSECYPSGRESWLKRYWNNFYRGITIKTKDWEYEQEYRLILQDGFGQFDEEDARKLSYDFNSLKGIIFGMNTSYEDKSRIVEVTDKKCKENGTDLKFYQAYYSPENGDIRKYEIYSRRSRGVLHRTHKIIDKLGY